MDAASHPLHGLRVLIVEDEPLVSMLIEEFLREIGCEVACSASRIPKAIRGLETASIDAAVLDLNVAGASTMALAETLDQRGIPFIFASGYGVQGVDSRWHTRPMLQKPFTAGELRSALLAALSERRVASQQN